MKRIVSILATLALILSLAPAAFAEDSYIPAPYDPNAVDPTATYLEPAFYENENGPTIGVTTVGVIVKDGLYFKDLNKASCSTPWPSPPTPPSWTWSRMKTAPSILPPS